jgi:uncharacterized protein YdeI (YjbR/CyaY-like superfamily)
MQSPGLRVIEQAKKDGSWDRLKVTDGNKIPDDLILEFKKYPASLENFKNFPPSSQRAILEWIALAKTEETRKKRTLETAKLAAKNVRANHYRQSKSKI